MTTSSAPPLWWCPTPPADRAWCEEIADRVAAYTWEHRDEFTFSGNFAEPADAVRDAVAFAGKTAVITDSGDNCGAGAAGHNTQMLASSSRPTSRASRSW